MNIEQAQIESKLIELRKKWLVSKKSWERKVIELQAKPLKSALRILKGKTT